MAPSCRSLQRGPGVKARPSMAGLAVLAGAGWSWLAAQPAHHQDSAALASGWSGSCTRGQGHTPVAIHLWPYTCTHLSSSGSRWQASSSQQRWWPRTHSLDRTCGSKPGRTHLQQLGADSNACPQGAGERGHKGMPGQGMLAVMIGGYQPADAHYQHCGSAACGRKREAAPAHLTSSHQTNPKKK